jgi:homoserine O-acetyltransferase
VSYAELSAVSGHDAFLMEDEHYHGVIKSYFQKIYKQL